MSATSGLGGFLNRGGDWLADLHRRAVAGVNAGGQALPLPGVPPAPAAVAAAPLAPGLPGATDAGDAVTSGPPPLATETAPASGEAPPQKPHQGTGLTHQQTLENSIWENEQQQAAQNVIIANADASSSQRENARTRLASLTTAYTSLLSQLGTEIQRQETNKEKETKAKNGDTRTQRVTHNGVTAVITERYDNGQWSYVPNSAQPETGLLGQADPRTAVDLQTAQVGLLQAQQQLAAEQDPLKKAQLQLAVDQARFTLQQAQAKGPLDLQTAQLQYDRARTEYEQATDPVAKETRAVALEQARVALDTAKQGLARSSAPQIVPTDTTSPVIMTRDPNTGALKTEPNPAYQGPTFTDATAAYNAQVPRLQQAARTERDRLLELQRQGAISEADAERQFTQWFAGNVETPLAGYRAAAEEAQRKEQRETEALQRVEDARVEALNRQREQLGLEAGQKAMLQLAEIAPQIRTPQFLDQFGATVARMSQRAGAQSAEAAAAIPSGSTFTKDTFSAEQARPHVPDFNAFAQQATQRALAQISPAVAARIGANAPPPLPQGPTLQGMLAGLPYRGPLAGLPSPTSGLLPTPGVNQAQDIGGGMARTPYGPGGNVWLDWALPQG